MLGRPNGEALGALEPKSVREVVPQAAGFGQGTLTHANSYEAEQDVRD